MRVKCYQTPTADSSVADDEERAEIGRLTGAFLPKFPYRLAQGPSLINFQFLALPKRRKSRFGHHRSYCRLKTQGRRVDIELEDNARQIGHAREASKEAEEAG
jgi:hypothetical protein